MIEKIEFENKEIDIQELPKLEDLTFNKIEKKYLFVLLFRVIVTALVFNAAGLFFIFVSNMEFPSERILYTLLGIDVLFIIRALLIIVAFKKRAYALRERDITYQRGIIYFKQTTVSINRMQHVELIQPFLMKIFKLATVKIYTAGGSQSDISIAGITKEKGEQIKNLLTEKLSKHE